MHDTSVLYALRVVNGRMKNNFKKYNR